MFFAFAVHAASLLICSVQSQKFLSFPSNFKFGIASSVYQTEGAGNTDGKGENIFDHLFHTHPDIVVGRQNADVSADSYHRFKDDVQMLKNVGVDFYRFSISWTRVLPNGNLSLINEAGLKYYDNLIDELLKNGIEPIITIYHWDLPQSIQELGGLNNPLFIGYFEQYAEVLFQRFHDRVNKWVTFNEPIVFCNWFLPDQMTTFVKGPFSVDNYLCAHHVLLANAKAYDLYKRKYSKIGDQVGISLNSYFPFPKDDDSAADVAAADRYLQFNIGLFAHPIFSRNGDYPKIMRDIVDSRSKLEGRSTSRLPVMTDIERQLIKGTSDFFGVNYYSSRYVTSRSINSNFIAENDIGFEESIDPAWPLSKSWHIYSVPEGLRALLNWIRTEYDNPEVMIHENGWSDDGELGDLGRIKYLQSHLNATLYAIVHDGCNVTAHTTWSLLDSFEWVAGYGDHLGLYHVDHNATDLKRTPKGVSWLLTRSHQNEKSSNGLFRLKVIVIWW